MAKTSISNYGEAVMGIIDMLVENDADPCFYQRDIYMYVDDETGKARLEWFENVGGRSWLDDGHILICEVRPSYPDASIVWAEDMTAEEIAEELKIMYGYEYKERAWELLDEAGVESC